MLTANCHCPNQLRKLILFLFVIYLDCTSPFVVKFSTTILGEDTKIAPSDYPQRGISCLILPHFAYLLDHIYAYSDHIRLTNLLIVGFCFQYQQVSCGAQP